MRAEHLKGMTGIQYLAEEVPGPTPDAPIFVIQKLLRSAPEQEPQVRASPRFLFLATGRWRPVGRQPASQIGRNADRQSRVPQPIPH